MPNFKQRSVDIHQFSMIPRADIPRSSFRVQSAHKTTFDAGFLIPVYCEEVLPGDTFNVRMVAFCRMATPIYPVMDNLHLESFFFFVPNRLVWANWQKFQGEQVNPGDSISYTVPQVVSPVGGYPVNSLYDYFGLPTVGQVGGAATISTSVLPFRAYNLIWNQWFRDENLQNSVSVPTGDGPDLENLFSRLRRGKRHDYFTSCLPWTQKGGVAAGVPITGTAPVIPSVGVQPGGGVAGTPYFQHQSKSAVRSVNASANMQWEVNPTGNLTTTPWHATDVGLMANLTGGSIAATVNSMRQAFQIQRVLERDARGGTRYTEIVRAHFGVVSPDARLQRPEYLGGGYSPVKINPVAQTSATGVTGTPLGNLSGFATSLGMGHRFSQSFTEHGYIIGLVNVRADLTYQQGIRRHWKRSTRYDFYMPAFAHLGEQAVLNSEIYADGSATDSNVFGYQERWAEYHYNPSMITGLFRSTAAGTLDGWHLAQRFSSVPTLNSTFIQDNPPLSRVLAVGTSANGAQFLADLFFDAKVTRPMPLYSVPGLVDHF